MSRGGDLHQVSKRPRGLVIPPLRTWQEAQPTQRLSVDASPNKDRRIQFSQRVSLVASFLAENKGDMPLPAFLNKVRFNEIWYFAAMVRNPYLLWSGETSHAPQTLNRIRRYGRTLARYLNPHWSSDCLKAFLESEVFRGELRKQIEMINDLGRYEDWIRRLPNHKASGNSVKVRR